MITFILRRLAVMIPTLLIVSLVTFFIIQLPPGDYLTTYMASLASTGEPANIEKLDKVREQYGLHHPLPVQYLRWLKGMLTGDLGQSMLLQKPVATLIWERLGITAFVCVLALLLAWLIALPIGIYSAVRQYGIVDYITSFFAMVGTATPPFLLALVLLFLGNRYLGMSLGGLYSEEYINATEWTWGRFVDLMKHLWLPVLILAVSSTGGLMRTMRANLLDQMQMPYVDTARAKGLPERRVIMKYPVRIAINPLVSTIGWMFPQMISATVIVDVVLDMDATGSMMLKALLAQDMYLAGAMVMMLSVLTMVGTLVSDVLLAWVDPRIRFESGRR